MLVQGLQTERITTGGVAGLGDTPFLCVLARPSEYVLVKREFRDQSYGTNTLLG